MDNTLIDFAGTKHKCLVPAKSYKKFVCSAALDAGFSRARILSPFEPEKFRLKNSPPLPENYSAAAASIIVCALPYGNQHENMPAPPENGHYRAGIIAPFARFNYYREAVKRMKRLSLLLRARFGGLKSDYRIFCNSPIPEKPIAEASGLGAAGKNGLIISPEAGSLFVIAAMTLPVPLESDPSLGQTSGTGNIISGTELESSPPPPDTEGPLPATESDACPPLRRFYFCEKCGDPPPCAAACPTGAVPGTGVIDCSKCIQWYASGNGVSTDTPLPGFVLAAWGNRLYGCSACQDACIRNKRPIQGVQTTEGALPAFIDVHNLLKLSDEEIKAIFKGTAMGLSWLGPRAIRRNAEAVLMGQSR
jgi:epoxyqueuosine reductase